MKAGKQAVANRRGANMLVRHDAAGDGHHLAIILHGFSGSMDEPHIRLFGDVFRANGISTLMIDATNSFNEADGGIEDASLTSQLNDLEDVIVWAATQAWYREPFILAGHSLGSAACLLYAEANASKVAALFPASSVLSGALRIAAYRQFEPALLAQMEKEGYRDSQCSYRPGLTGRRYWQPIVEDWSRYDALKDARHLTMPVLLVVGAADTATPPDQQQMLYERLRGDREIHIIPDADHCFLPNGLGLVAGHLDRWLKRKTGIVS